MRAIEWDRDSQPSNGSRSVCLHRDGGLSLSRPRYGEWTNCVDGREYAEGDVVGWMSDEKFPFATLRSDDLISLLKSGVTRDGVVTDEVALDALRKDDPGPLPCPFCGDGRIEVRDVPHGDGSDDRDHFCFCPSCACEGPWSKVAGGAVRQWNMRTGGRP